MHQILFSLFADAIRPGYLAIHLIGLSTGTLLLPPSPSYFRRLQAQLRSSNPTIGRTITSDPVYDSSDDDTPRHRSARIQHRRENDKTATELFSYAALWWIFLGLILFMQIGGGVSRRMVCLFIFAAGNALTRQFLGQSALHHLGRRIQYHIHPRISSIGSTILPFPAFEVDLLSHVEAESTARSFNTTTRQTEQPGTK